MPAILVRNLPEETVDALKRRALRHSRSLQQELHLILEAAVQPERAGTPAEAAARIRAKLAASGRSFGESAALVREDRER